MIIQDYVIPFFQDFTSETQLIKVLKNNPGKFHNLWITRELLILCKNHGLIELGHKIIDENKKHADKYKRPEEICQNLEELRNIYLE